MQRFQGREDIIGYREQKQNVSALCYLVTGFLRPSFPIYRMWMTVVVTRTECPSACSRSLLIVRSISSLSSHLYEQAGDAMVFYC